LRRVEQPDDPFGSEGTAISDQDAQLLRAMHDEHADALLAHALRLVSGDRQRAEDLVQETLLRAWRHPEALDPNRGSVRAWLFTIARNLAIDAWRRRSARIGEVITDELPEPPQVVDEADRAVEAGSRRRIARCWSSASTRAGRWPRRRRGWAFRRAR